MNNQKETYLLRKAMTAYEGHHYNQAFKLFSEVLDNSPNNAEALFYLGNIFCARGEISKCVKAFKKVLQIDPDHTDAAISLSVVYNDIGQYENAKDVFNNADMRIKQSRYGEQGSDVHVNKKFAFKHYELAEMYLTYERYDEALFEYNKAIKLDSENVEARIKIAKVYSKMGFSSKAVAALKELINEMPSYLEARVALGILYYGTENVLEAQGEWQKVLSIDPENQEAKMYLELSSNATETRV
jgi:tetratricopeptide (TPR) repeat protein